MHLYSATAKDIGDKAKPMTAAKNKKEDRGNKDEEVVDPNPTEVILNLTIFTFTFYFYYYLGEEFACLLPTVRPQRPANHSSGAPSETARKDR